MAMPPVPEAGIRIAAASDADEVGRIMAAAFADDPVLTWVFAPPDRGVKLTAFFGFLAVEALVPLGATLLRDGCCAAWTPPGSPDWPAELGQRFSSVLEECCTADDLKRLGVLDTMTAAVHPGAPHWFLSIIATAPQHWGQGHGSSVLRAALAFIDEQNSPAYLESTNPRNISFYESAGFVVSGEVALPNGPTISTMWRDSAR